MPHRIEKLRETLRELEAELAEIDTLDEPSRQLLEEAHRDIDAALHKHEEEPLTPHSFIDRLSDATRELEESHPRLAQVLGGVVNALAQLGI